jgi:hypothetical protein
MLRRILPVFTGVAVAMGASLVGTSAHAEAGIKAGTLTCNVASGWGLIFGSSRDIKCVYSANPGAPEYYVGSIAKFGVDIGYTQNGVILWSVLAPAGSLAPGALDGSYAGVTGGATIGVGGDANVLIGGFNRSISLQPLSIEGNKGLNVAAGIASISLQARPPS